MCVTAIIRNTTRDTFSLVYSLYNLIDMGTEPFIMGWNEGPEKQELEKKPDRIALACPFPGCHLAFLHLNALRAHANQKHGLQIKMSNCALKVDGLKRLQRPQGYQGKRESLRSYHQKDRITAPPQEDLFPLLAQADQLLASIKTQPQLQITPFQRLHYRLHPTSLFPQAPNPFDCRNSDLEYQTPAPNISEYLAPGTLHQASHQVDENWLHALIRYPTLPSFPSAFQQAGVLNADQGFSEVGSKMPNQVPNSRSLWMTADTVEADRKTYRIL